MSKWRACAVPGDEVGGFSGEVGHKSHVLSDVLHFAEWEMKGQRGGSSNRKHSNKVILQASVL